MQEKKFSVFIKSQKKKPTNSESSHKPRQFACFGSVLLGFLMVFLSMIWAAEASAQESGRMVAQESSPSPEGLDTTMVPSGTLTATATLTPTTTLLPFPTVTFIYPPTATATDVLFQVERQPGDPGLAKPSPGLDWGKLARLWPLGLLLLVWAFLGAWFIFTQRSSE